MIRFILLGVSNTNIGFTHLVLCLVLFVYIFIKQMGFFIRRMNLLELKSYETIFANNVIFNKLIFVFLL